MKRFLLLISAMLVMGAMVAQDVYYSGYYTKSGQKYATVYKNDAKLYETALGSGDNTSNSLAVDPATNDVYWVRNSESYGDVFKNDAIFLNNNTGTHVNRVHWSNINNYLYSGGYKTGSDGIRYATIWKGTDTNPYLQPNNGNGKASEVSDVIYVQTSANAYWNYYCGYANSTTSGSPRATVWKGQDVLYTLSSVDSYAISLAYYDGHVYTAGYEYSGSNKVIKVWEDNTVLYTLTDASASAYVYKLVVDCGDIYVVGWGTARAQYVWKNGQVLSDMSSGGYDNGLDVNSTGYYVGRTTGSNVCSIYKNGSVLYSSIADCEMIYDLVVTEVPADNSVRSLPYTEGFEIGETDWTSWTKIDGDGAFSTQLAYWHRAGRQDCTPHAGSNYCARHRGDGNSQTGWLISPRLFLQPGRDYTTLTFFSWAGTNTNKSVWISTNSDPTATDSYTKVWESNDQQGWDAVNINLADYQGELIYIGFKYSSNAISTWLIDDISVTETWALAGAYDLPFSEDFSNTSEPGWIWYVFDNDMTGDYRCWKNIDGKACHPWGQNNGVCQVGWMFTPPINLPAGHNYHITFSSANESSGPQMSSELWLAVNDMEIPNPANYTTMLWQETESQPEHTVDVDLSAYAGQTIRLCFCYRGVYAHNWSVDNVSITSNDGINEVDANAIAVYPNPTSESIRINGLDKETEVRIYNVMGVLVKTVITNGQDEINVYDFPAGLYIAKFGDNAVTFTKE